jgi:hypothetical protein
MQIDIRSDVKDLTKSLNRIQRKQIPFATSRAINTLAFDVRKTLQDGLDIHMDRPTPYTKRGVQVEKSTKKDLVAEVGFRSKTFGKGRGEATQASYMKRQIEGGTRKARSKAIPVPVPKNLKTNKYGSIVRGKVKRLLQDKDKYFSGVPKGIPDAPGIWQRMPANSKRKKNRGGKIRMVIAWEPKTQYKSRFPFKRIVETTIKTNFRRRFDFELREALKTAR